MAISTWRRLLWHAYRTPFARAVKIVGRAGASANIRRRRALAQALPATDLEQTYAAALNRDGYAVVTAAIDAAAAQALSVAAEAKLSRAHGTAVRQESTHKDFWTRLLDEDMEAGALPADNAFVAFALQQPVLSILARAYGELPQLDSVLLTLSQPTSKALSYSQLWHRDYDDTRVIKLFVYLTDVGSQDDGPFTFIAGPDSDRFGFWLHSHRPDEAVTTKLADPSRVRSMVAPRLSAFMVETTRCLHMGSRLAAGHERLLYTATFISVPRIFPEPPPRFRLTGSESDVVRCILSPS
jgi:hypothetical protein